MDAGLLVAREGELEAIRALLRGDGADTRALVLEGDPGVGKTSLWERGVAWAREDGRRVLVARASEDEGGLPFAGLIDLFDAVDERGARIGPGAAGARAGRRALPGRPDGPPAGGPGDLPRRALRAAGAERGRAHPGRDRRPAVARQRVGGGDRVRRPPAARRTRHVPARPPPRPAYGGREGVPRRAARAGRRRRHQPGRDAADPRRPARAAPAAPPAAAGYETTMGNPLFAIEVGRMLAGRDLDTLGDDLPVPDDVEDLLGLRVADLDEPARRVLLAIALHADLRVGAAARPRGPRGPGRGGRGGRGRPSTASVSGPPTRCWRPRPSGRRRTTSSASSTGGWPRSSPTSNDAPSTWRWRPPVPDEELATGLDAAAARAAARGATRLAIDLAAHAWRLTPPETPDVERVLALGRHLHDAGEKQRLTELLGPRLESLPRRGRPRDGVPAADRGPARAGQRRHRRAARAGPGRGGRRPRAARAGAVVPRRERRRRRGPRGRASPTSGPPRPSTLSQQGTPDDQRLAVNTLTWTQALRGRPVAHLVERYYALSTERATMARHPERIAGQRLVWRGRGGAGAGRSSPPSATRSRSGPRPTPWPGCTCASWSCAPVGGTRSSGCWTTGPRRSTAPC